MIRCGGPSDAGLRRSQTLRKDVVKGSVRKAVIPLGELLVPTKLTFKTVLVASSSQGIECSFCLEHSLIMIRIEIVPDHICHRGVEREKH
jgi:hypothetical protein